MRTPLARIRYGGAVLGGVLAVAVVGYCLLDGRSVLDSLYMVVITISSVGYGETSQLSPQVKLFTVAVIVVGMSAAGYTIGGLLQMMTEGEIARALGRRRTTREIERLANHVIICGFGRIGQALARDLQRQGEPLIVVDNDIETIAEAVEEEMLTLTGDAADEDVLIEAGVKRAKTLVTALPSDALNVFVTLTSRNLHPEIQIIARAESRTTEKKLIQAGADRVVMPAIIGAQRIAGIITRPATVDLMELVADRDTLAAQFDEATITPDCTLAGRTIRDTNLRRDHRLLVVAIKKPDGDMVFHPDADYTLDVGETLILMGRPEDIRQFREVCGIRG